LSTFQVINGVIKGAWMRFQLSWKLDICIFSMIYFKLVDSYRQEIMIYLRFKSTNKV